MNELERLYSGEVKLLFMKADGKFSTVIDAQHVVALAGSFNPLHRGHRRLLEAAEKVSGHPGIFEISIENVDKPDMPRDELEARLEQFRGFAEVAVTRARLFADKARLLPRAWFVVGYDTAVRLLEDRYYTGESAIDHMKRLEESGTKFLVAGRVGDDGKFRDLDDIEVPAELEDMFIHVPEEMFREDVSSTELRERQSE